MSRHILNSEKSNVQTPILAAWGQCLPPVAAVVGKAGYGPAHGGVIRTPDARDRTIDSLIAAREH
jgi:hypothetical protein